MHNCCATDMQKKCKTLKDGLIWFSKRAYIELVSEKKKIEIVFMFRMLRYVFKIIWFSARSVYRSQLAF